MIGVVRELSSGLNSDREAIVRECPAIESWTENLLFTPYDPQVDIGMWLHLGTVPNEWEMWEDRVLITLPEEQGVLSMWAYHRTEPGRRPAGANLSFRCIEPFRRWQISFDGFCLRTPSEHMRTATVADGAKSRVTLELDVECVTPVWDAEAAASADTGKGGMEEQDWAREHYEQLFRATGQLVVDGAAIDFDGSGWRDHSRGPRGSGPTAAWGGHIISGAVMPSGRAFGLSQYWAPDGRITLEGAYVVESDGLEHRSVVETPGRAVLSRSGQHVALAMTTGGGGPDAHITGVVRNSIWMSMAPGLPYGVLDPRQVYAVSWAEVTWDGEIGHAYLERSDLR